MNLRLAATHISKSYNGNRVLDDCSFSFDRSGTYVLMGPNGCGKSTFLRICALLEEPDAGEINYLSQGHPANKDIRLRRRTTLVLPRVGVFNTTVFRNVAYGLTIRRIRGKEREERVMKVLHFVGLGEKRDQGALTLSSGETQRLGLARALVIEPEILFLDEPTASVDRRNIEIIEDIIMRMKKGGRSTVIITTHDRLQAERLADFLLVIKEGKISADRSPLSF
jgi:tungstate transport system ATP-binding protein